MFTNLSTTREKCSHTTLWNAELILLIKVTLFPLKVDDSENASYVVKQSELQTSNITGTVKSGYHLCWHTVPVSCYWSMTSYAMLSWHSISHQWKTFHSWELVRLQLQMLKMTYCWKWFLIFQGTRLQVAAFCRWGGKIRNLRMWNFHKIPCSKYY